VKIRNITVVSLAWAMISGAAMADDTVHDPKAGHDMGTMHHQENKWMFEYRWMRMNMEGLLDGTDKVSASDISGSNMSMTAPAAGKDYQMAPTKMTMDMHMLMAMRGISESLSVMGMLNYVRNEMDMVMYVEGMDPMLDSMSSGGLGDSMLGVVYRLNPALELSMGLSVPTGSIDEKDTVMEMGGMMGMGSMTEVGKSRLPYFMQLGSGTYDVVPGVTYRVMSGVWEWGAKGTFTYRMGKNNNDYTLGNRVDVSGWTRYRINSQVQMQGRLAFEKWGRIKGQDPEIDPMMSPDSDPDAQGGTRVDALVGINAGLGDNHLLNFEVGAPVHQNLNGPQLKTQWLLSLSYHYML